MQPLPLAGIPPLLMPEGLQAGRKDRAEDGLTSLVKGELTSSRPSVRLLFWGDQVLPGPVKWEISACPLAVLLKIKHSRF